MTNVKKLLPILALTAAFLPMTGAAFNAGAAQTTAYLSTPVAHHQLAASSKGRPAEFSPAGSQLAANAKGRPAEFTPATA